MLNVPAWDQLLNKQKSDAPFIRAINVELWRTVKSQTEGWILLRGKYQVWRKIRHPVWHQAGSHVWDQLWRAIYFTALPR